MPLTVVVLGSAPDARWPRNDFLISANRSLLYYPEAVRDTSRVNSFGFPNDQRALFESEDLLRRLRSGWLESVTVGTRAEEEVGPITEEFTSLLRSNGFPSTEVLVVDRAERRETWERASGLREPILHGLGSYGVSGVRHAVVSSLTYAYKRSRARRASAPQHLVRRRAIFRPSTGVIALCRAMNRFGSSAEYVLAGVSLAWPRYYPDPERDAFRGPEDRAPVPIHINADTQVLRRLATKWNLRTTNAELADVLCIPHHEV